MEYIKVVKPWPQEYLHQVMEVAPLHSKDTCFLCSDEASHRITLLNGKTKNICEAHMLGLKEVDRIGEVYPNDRGYEKYKCFRGD